MSILKILLLIVLLRHRLLAMTWLFLIYALFSPFLLIGILLAGVISIPSLIGNLYKYAVAN